MVTFARTTLESLFLSFRSVNTDGTVVCYCSGCAWACPPSLGLKPGSMHERSRALFEFSVTSLRGVSGCELCFAELGGGLYRSFAPQRDGRKTPYQRRHPVNGRSGTVVLAHATVLLRELVPVQCCPRCRCLSNWSRRSGTCGVDNIAYIIDPYMIDPYIHNRSIHNRSIYNRSIHNRSIHT